MIGGGGSEIAVILLNESGSIVDAHASCTETFGWRREELIGKDIRDLLQYGRDLLMNQLHLLEEDDSAGNTSFTIRVLAKRKDQQQFPARATIRRFQELQCWTVAFYRADTEPAESDVQPCVSPQEIALAKRALEEKSGGKRATPHPEPEVKKGENMSVSRLWRNSRLLFGSREEKAPESETSGVAEVTRRLAEVADEKRIAEETSALVAQCVQAGAAAAPPGPSLASVPPAERARGEERSAARPSPAAVAAPPLEPASAPRISPPAQPSSESTVALAKLKAELEKERGDRTRTEQRAAALSSQVQALHLQLSEGLDLERENQTRLAALDQELRDTQELLALSKAELEDGRRERQATSEQIDILRELNTRLETNVDLLEKARTEAESVRAELQTRLERSEQHLKETELALDRERVLRRQAESTLQNATRENRAAEQVLSLEIGRLKSTLATAEIDKLRGEKEVLRSRLEVSEAATDARNKSAHFRKKFAEVLEHINGTTRELLQSPLTDEQKCVIESLLQDVISLEGTLETKGLTAEAGQNDEKAVVNALETV